MGGEKLLQKDEEFAAKHKDRAAVVKRYLDSGLGYIQKHVKLRTKDARAERIVLERYQSAILYSPATLKFVIKGRQLGISLLAGLDSLAGVHALNPTDSTHISRNLDESKEKIRVVWDAYELIPDRFKRRLRGTSFKAKMEFKTKGGGIVVVRSYAQVHPRGPHGRVYMDEFAWMEHQRDMLVATMFCTARVGEVWIISTPRRKDDAFYDLDQLLQYPELTARHPDLQIPGLGEMKPERFVVPWWHSTAMVLQGKFDEAQKVASGLKPIERLERFGSEKLWFIYNVLGRSIEEFQVEEECQYADDAKSYYSDELLDQVKFDRRVIVDDQYAATIDYEGGGMKEAPPSIETILKKQRVKIKWYADITELIADFAKGHLGRVWFIGVDPGDTDGAAIVLFEQVGNISMIRHHVKFTKAALGTETYGVVENYLLNIGSHLPVDKVVVDTLCGQGKPLIVKLRAMSFYGPAKIETISPSNQENYDMAADFRIRMELSMLAIPDDSGALDDAAPSICRDIKKARITLTPGGVRKLEVSRDKHGHGDLYYAAMYGLRSRPPATASTSLGGIPDPRQLPIPRQRLNTLEGSPVERYKEMVRRCRREAATTNPLSLGGQGLSQFDDMRPDDMMDIQEARRNVMLDLPEDFSR
jgi:hypothetical protein